MMLIYVFFFQAEDGIRDLVRSRGLGDVYKGQRGEHAPSRHAEPGPRRHRPPLEPGVGASVRHTGRDGGGRRVQELLLPEDQQDRFEALLATLSLIHI